MGCQRGPACEKESTLHLSGELRATYSRHRRYDLENKKSKLIRSPMSIRTYICTQCRTARRAEAAAI